LITFLTTILTTILINYLYLYYNTMDLSRIPQLQESNGCIQVDDMVRLIENDPAIQKIPVPNGGQLRNYILYQAGYEGYNAELFPDGVGNQQLWVVVRPVDTRI